MSNLDEFSENFQRGKGGGVISDPKSFVADFATKVRTFIMTVVYYMILFLMRCM